MRETIFAIANLIRYSRPGHSQEKTTSLVKAEDGARLILWILLFRLAPG
jgi:hypothetical protein